MYSHLVNRNFIHSKRHPSCVRDLVEYFKIHAVCLALFNVYRHLLIYLYKKTETFLCLGLYSIKPCMFKTRL